MRTKRNAQPIIRLGADKRPAPSPEFFGLGWKEVSSLLEENEKLQARSSVLNEECVGLQETISSLERLEIAEMANAVRGGEEERESEELEKARAELERVKKLSATVRLAFDRVRSEFHRQILKRRESWTKEINGKLEGKLLGVESALLELRAAQKDLYALSAVKDWLERPQRSFGFAEGPHQLNTFDGTINLGDAYKSILSAARNVVHPQHVLVQQGFVVQRGEVT